MGLFVLCISIFSFLWRIYGQKSCQKAEGLDSFHVSKDCQKRAKAFLVKGFSVKNVRVSQTVPLDWKHFDLLLLIRNLHENSSLEPPQQGI